MKRALDTSYAVNQKRLLSQADCVIPDFKACSSILLFVTVFVNAVLEEKMAFSNDSSSVCSICNSGGILLSSEDGEIGQGYLVLDENGEYDICTIRHVRDSADKTLMAKFPGAFIRDYFEKSRFKCETENGDVACCADLGGEFSALLMQNISEQPISRIREHEKLQIGRYLAFLRPFADAYSLARIVEIKEDVIVLDSSREKDGKTLVSDAFCQGGSGGPALLVDFDPETEGDIYAQGSLKFVTDEEGNPFSVGEVSFGEIGVGSLDMNMPNSECFSVGNVARVARN